MNGEGIALAFGLLFFGKALVAWALILPALAFGLWGVLRRRGWARALATLSVFVVLSAAALIVLRPELDDRQAAQRVAQQRADRIPLPDPLPKTLVIETSLDLEPDWPDIVLEIAESEAFGEVMSRSPTGESHVEMVQSENCLSSRLSTPKYVAANGFVRCGRLVEGAERPDNYLLLEVGAPDPTWKGTGVEVTLRLFLVDRGSKSLLDYGEVRARMKRDIVRRVLMIPGPREGWNPADHLCSFRRVKNHRIELLGFLLSASGKSEFTEEHAPAAGALLVRAKSILASHDPPSEAAAAAWAIFSIMPPGSPERRALGHRMVDYSSAHDDELIQAKLPFGVISALRCAEGGVEL